MHLNDNDLRELTAQMEYPPELACAAHTGDESVVAWHKGKPIAAFGFSLIIANCWSAWMFGTSRSYRAVPAITEYFHANLPRAKAMGVGRFEARSIEGHTRAHSWLQNSLGFTPAAPLKNFGRNNETFILFERVL